MSFRYRLFGIPKTVEEFAHKANRNHFSRADVQIETILYQDTSVYFFAQPLARRYEVKVIAGPDEEVSEEANIHFVLYDISVTMDSLSDDSVALRFAESVAANALKILAAQDLNVTLTRSYREVNTYS